MSGAEDKEGETLLLATLFPGQGPEVETPGPPIPISPLPPVSHLKGPSTGSLKIDTPPPTTSTLALKNLDS